MSPILAISGKSNSGKTTLLVKLVQEFTAKGLRVASVKHAAHGFSLDRVGSDSWRHLHAGASPMLLIGERELALQATYSNPEETPGLYAACEKFFPDVDLILAEGFKSVLVPRLEVVKDEPIFPCEDETLLAYVAQNLDQSLCGDKKIFDPEAAGDIAEFIITKFEIENQQSREAQQGKRRIRFYADGRKVPMKSFVQDIFIRTLLGMSQSLKGCESVKRMRFEIDLGEEKR